MAQDHKINRLFETSAKTGSNVEEVFSLVARELFHQSKLVDSDSITDPICHLPPVIIGDNKQ